MIALKNLQVDLGDFQLRDISLEVEKGEYFIILGPTGAGKTVLLEAIAGLHPIIDGEIWFDSREISRLKPEKRGIGFVYQDQALFPHLTVEENIAFGLKLSKCPQREMKAKIERMAQLVGIGHLLSRKPDTLSGGERQKVALARALITEPDVLLLDEPLSALDPETREVMQRELSELHRKVGVTIIHVTHNFEEAIALGERVAVLNEGRIVQVGKPEDIFRRPASEFVARFALSRNIFAGEARAEGDGYGTIEVEGTKLIATTEAEGKVRFSLRPEDILISKERLRSTARNSLQGTITHISDRGTIIYVTVSVPQEFVCLITRQSFEELELREGERVFITFKASAIHIF
jgi:molybdenum ABC transporter ATP-binding protein